MPKLPPRLLALTPYVLSLAGRAARGAAVDALAPRALRLDELAALAVLADFGPAPQRELAERLRLDPGDVVRLVDALERRGLAQRRRDPADRRRQIVTIGAAGRRALARGLDACAAAADELLAPLDARERAQLHALLRRVLAHADARAPLDP
ncbi:MAG: MarR family winged helix-turn-helix transcriptional regulator [Conexibacter sp.]